MIVLAKKSNIKSSAQKLRNISSLVRGKSVLDAMLILNYINKKSSIFIVRLIKSSVHNFMHSKILLNKSLYSTSVQDLKINEIFVNEGKKLKRIMIRAKGRSDRLLRRTCHLNISLSSI